jgi:hypothetical protein
MASSMALKMATKEGDWEEEIKSLNVESGSRRWRI